MAKILLCVCLWGGGGWVNTQIHRALHLKMINRTGSYLTMF